MVMEKKLKGRALNLGSQDEISIIELAKEILKIAIPQSHPPKIGYRGFPKGDPRRRVPQIAEARNLLGWEPQTSLREGLSRTVDWFRMVQIPRHISNRQSVSVP